MKREQKLRLLDQLEKQCVNCANYHRNSCDVFKGNMNSIIGTSWLNKWNVCTAHATPEHIDAVIHDVELYKEVKKDDL